jgi:hypothetical protein
MNLSDDEVRQSFYCASEVLRARRRGAGPVLPWLVKLVRRYELELATSRSRQDHAGGMQPLDHEKWIGTREAAAILGWTSRQVQRRAADLEGRKSSAGWIFLASNVIEYSEGLTHARDSA